MKGRGEGQQSTLFLSMETRTDKHDKVTCTLSRFLVFTLSPHLFLMMSSFRRIGCWDCFGFGFTTTN